MPQPNIAQSMQIGLGHHQAGQLRQAEDLYRLVLAQQPNHFDALHLLGVVLCQKGELDLAVDLLQRALALNPDYAPIHCNLGLALKNKGQHDAAVEAFRRAIALRPGYSEALNNLGLALKEQGQLDQAIVAHRQAIVLAPGYAEAHYNLGNALKDAGRRDEAVAAYRQASVAFGQTVANRPGFPGAYYDLGNALRESGQLDQAIAAYRQAVAVKPDYPEAYINLGIVLRTMGRFDEGVAALRQAIAFRPGHPDGHFNLGNALKDTGQFDQVIASYQQAIVLRPNYVEAHYNLGNALRESGQLDQAIAAYRQAVAVKPDYPEAYVNLGLALCTVGRSDEGAVALRKAIALRPGHPEGHFNLGNALRDTGQSDQAIASYRQAIVLRPNYVEAHYNLGNVLKDQRQLDPAIAAFNQAIALNPNYADAYINLGNSLKDKRQLDDAIAAYRQAVTVGGNAPEADNSLVYTMHFHPAYDVHAIGQEHRRWNRQHAEPLRELIKPTGNDRNPERRLRIGYISPDFRAHPVGRFLLPLLANHDKKQVEVFAYAQIPTPDALTQSLRSHVDVWQSITGLTDAQVADLVRQDQIDILVDLTMHMANSRLLVFARKPAPIQVTYLAYCSTTGLDAIDYRFSDPYLDPPGMDDSSYSERTVRLPETYWCYQPSMEPPKIGRLPALQQGFITFGCLNNFCKVSDPTLAAWTKLLLAVPNSQILIHAHEGTHRQRLQDQLKQDGVEPNRVRFVAFTPNEKYFDLYQQIDIALDTFPYGGGTTTCDALWMGVPVVSLVGQTAVGRGGLSILSNIGLPELVGRSEEDYVRIASELARDIPRLENLRSTLRQKMERSPLMDAPRFARNVEAAYRTMWRTGLTWGHAAAQDDREGTHQ
jgi:predicted O-linked N-acetylglucosamine transferase (SPINDLY family)